MLDVDENWSGRTSGIVKRTCMARKVLFVRRRKYSRKLYELNVFAERSVEAYRLRIACRLGGVVIIQGKGIAEIRQALHPMHQQIIGTTAQCNRYKKH